MLHIPGVDSLMVYVTDQHRPVHAKAAARFVVPDNMMVDSKSLPTYYSACVAMVKSIIVSPHRNKRVRDGV